MNFFRHQENRRRQTWVLGSLLVLTVLLIALAAYGVTVLFLFYYASYHQLSLDIYRPIYFFGITGAVGLMVAGGAAYMWRKLSGHAEAMVERLGGIAVSFDTQDPAEKQLRNVVEEMAIAARMPIPRIYVLKEERAINAFAAGLNLNDSVVAVTQGALTLLSRDELQAVVAHEFSHILNEDIQINIRLSAVLHGILILSLLGDILLRQRIRSRGGKNAGILVAIFAVGLLLKLLGFVGLLAARAIKSAISRQREFLADASAVQFTRHPTGLTSALKKIGGYRWGATIRHPRAEEASHFYFENGLRSMSGWFSTHPSLLDRIRIMEPKFNGTFPKLSTQESIPGVTTQIHQAHQASSFSPTNLVLDQAKAQCDLVRQHLSPYLVSEHAMNLIIAVLHPSEAVLSSTGFALGTQVDGEVIQKIQHLLAQTPALKALTVLEFAVPLLRFQEKESMEHFLRTMKTLLSRKESFTPFEFFAAMVIRHQVDAVLHPKASTHIDYYSLTPLFEHAQYILGYVAYVGHADDAQADQAYQAGIQLMYRTHRGRIPPRDRCVLKELDRHLKPIAHSVLSIRQRFVRACIRSAEFDRTLTEAEEQILHAIACRLDCSLLGLPTETN